MPASNPLRWAWGSHNARLLWLGRLCTFVAEQLAEIALVWLAWELTRSASRVALVLFLARAPYWAVLWWAGVWADRWPRQALVAWSDLAGAGVAAAIWLLHASGSLAWPVLLALAFLLSVARAVELPAVSAQLPELVARERLAAINIVLDNTKRLGRLLAPLLASGLLLVVATPSLYAFAALGLLAMAACARRMRPQQQSAPARSARAGSELRTAWQVLRHERSLLLIVLCFALYNPAYALCHWVLLPRLVGELASADAGSWYAIALACFGGGALASNLFVSLRGLRDPQAAAAAGFAIVVIGFAALALATRLPLAFVLAAVAASGVPLMDIAQSALINQRIPTQHQGKVFALARYLAELGVALGLAMGGWLADAVSTPLAFALCGLYAAPLWLLVARHMQEGNARDPRLSSRRSGAAPRIIAMRNHVLAAGSCRTLPVAAGATLACSQGLLWLTFEPDDGRLASEDRLVSPGCRYQAPAAGCIHVSPLRNHGAAVFALEPPSAVAAPRRRPWLLRRLAAPGRAGR